MVKQPFGNLDNSFAHCSAPMPVIVVSMPEIIVFTPLLKGRSQGAVIFPDKCVFLHLKSVFQRGVENFASRLFLFLFSKCLLADNPHFRYQSNVKHIVLYKIRNLLYHSNKYIILLNFRANHPVCSLIHFVFCHHIARKASK